MSHNISHELYPISSIKETRVLTYFTTKFIISQFQMKKLYVLCNHIIDKLVFIDKIVLCE